MTATLRVRWRGAIYEVTTCLESARAKAAADNWPDGVIDLALLFAPNRPPDRSGWSDRERALLVRQVLSSLGEFPTRMPGTPRTEVNHAWLEERLGKPAPDAGSRANGVRLIGPPEALERDARRSSSGGNGNGEVLQRLEQLQGEVRALADRNAAASSQQAQQLEQLQNDVRGLGTRHEQLQNEVRGLSARGPGNTPGNGG